MEAATIVCRNRTAEDVAADLLAARKMREEADKLVLEMEQELIQIVGAPGEGSKTHRLNGYKIEVKGVINRKVDWDILDTICRDLEAQEPFFVAPVKIKRELDVTEVKRLFKDHPGVYARVAKAITATPGKTGVTVSRTE